MEVVQTEAEAEDVEQEEEAGVAEVDKPQLQLIRLRRSNVY